MAQDKFLIAPYETGWQNDRKPWLIPDDAFEYLRNAYLYRGRIRKRWGTFLLNQDVDATVAHLYSRLRIKIGTTNASGNLSGTAPGTLYKVGQLFSIGTSLFTVNIAGTPANLLRSDGLAATATYNTSTGAFDIQGAPPTTAVYFYPAEPVMGIVSRELNPTEQFFEIKEETIAFDTQFAYERDEIVDGWDLISGVTFTGSNVDYFWSANVRDSTNAISYLFVTNGTSDGVYTYDGTTWTSLKPTFNASGDTIESAKIVIFFQGRTLFLNVSEKIGGGSPIDFIFRIRYSGFESPFGADAWHYPSGGFIDLPTSQSIVSADKLQDRIIIYCKHSTYELAKTGNQLVPFTLKQIDSTIGMESQFSIVHFDEAALGIGQLGVHACNGSSVQRIDDKIRDEVFRITNQQSGFNQVHGIRDYYTEQVYWTIPVPEDVGNLNFIPDRVLVYDYKTGAWAFFDDSIKTFGYFYNPSVLSLPQNNQSWLNTINQPVNPSDIRFFKQVICGNQEGFTFLIDQNTTRNAPSLQITDMGITPPTITIAAVNHNLQVGDFVLIEHALNVSNLNDTIYKIESVPSDDTFTINEPNATGSYQGRGVLSRVSKIDIFTKEYNFYLQKAMDTYIESIYCNVTRTDNGEITVDYSPDSGNESMVPASQSSGAIVGTNILSTAPHAIEPFESRQARLWHPVYFQGEGPVVQLRFYLSDDQMLDKDISLSDFQLHAMLFYVSPTGKTL